jgi:hypothetical protein
MVTGGVTISSQFSPAICEGLCTSLLLIRTEFAGSAQVLLEKRSERAHRRVCIWGSKH